MKRAHILGVGVDPVTMREALRLAMDMLKQGKHHIMTPNSEMLVRAANDDTFRSLLNQTDLNIPDSAGLLWAARHTGQELPERVAGVDFVTKLCMSLSSDSPVFLLGGKPGVAEQAAETLKRKNPSLRIAGTYAGSPDAGSAADIIRRINESEARLLLVAYGAPAQDFWINRHLMSFTTVRLAIGVGGTLDFLAGTVKRAPRFLQTAGLEWLWRLLLQPWRLGRIFTAVIRFPLLVLLRKREA